MIGNPFSSVKFLFYPEKLKHLIGEDWQEVAPITANLDATNICNLDCIWCYQKEFRESSPVLMRYSDMHKAIVQSRELDCKTAFFSGGGEPLCNNKVFPKTFYDVTELGMKCCLTTNGTLMHKYLEAISENCTYVKVSLNAGSRETYRKLHGKDLWNQVWQNVSDLQEVYDGLLGVDYVIHPENYREIFDFLSRAASTGVSYAGLRGVVIEGYRLNDRIISTVKDQVEKFKAENKDFTVFNRTERTIRRTLKEFDRCYATPLTVTVGADLNVYPCCATRGIKQLAFGNLHTETLREIWSGAKRKKIVESIDPKKCLVCKYTMANIILNELKTTIHPEFI